MISWNDIQNAAQNAYNDTRNWAATNPDKAAVAGAGAYIVGDGMNGFQTTDAAGDFVWNMSADSAGRLAAESTDWIPILNIPDAAMDSIQDVIENHDDSPENNVLYQASKVGEAPLEFIMDPGESARYVAGDVETVDNEPYNHWFEDANSGTPADGGSGTPTDTPTDNPTDTPTEGYNDTPTETPTDTPTETPTDTPTETPTETPMAEPGTDYVFGETFDSADQAALNDFFQDVGNVEHLDVSWQGSENGSGQYVLEAQNAQGETYTFDLAQDATYDGHSYDIDGEEIQEVIQAKADGEVWDLFDESEYVPNRG